MKLDGNFVLSTKDNIWQCSECKVMGVWPAADSLLCPACKRYIIPQGDSSTVVVKPDNIRITSIDI